MRINIEYTFGVLVNQWGGLISPILLHVSLKTTTSIVHALCYLCNWLIDENCIEISLHLVPLIGWTLIQEEVKLYNTIFYVWIRHLIAENIMVVLVMNTGEGMTGCYLHNWAAIVHMKMWQIKWDYGGLIIDQNRWDLQQLIIDYLKITNYKTVNLAIKLHPTTSIF